MGVSTSGIASLRESSAFLGVLQILPDPILRLKVSLQQDTAGTSAGMVMMPAEAMAMVASALSYELLQPMMLAPRSVFGCHARMRATELDPGGLRMC